MMITRRAASTEFTSFPWLLADIGGVWDLCRALEELLPEHVVEAVEELLLDGVHGPFEAVEQLGGVLVVHEEAIVEVEAVAAGVVDEPEQRLVPLGVDGRGLELQHRQHPPDAVRQELRLRGVRVVLGAGHLHHPAPLPLEDVEEGLGAGASRRAVADADLVEDEREAVPAVARGLRAEHGVGADDIEVRREGAEEEVLGELLDGEHVDEEGVAAEAVDGERAEDGLGGEDGGGEEHHVRVALAEVVRVGEEGGAERGGERRVVGPGVGEQRVALPSEGAGEELAEVAEPDDGDLEPLPLLQEPRRAGLVVERLGGVHRPDALGTRAERLRRREVPLAPPAGGGGEVGGGAGGRRRRVAAVGTGWLVEAEGGGGRRQHLRLGLGYHCSCLPLLSGLAFGVWDGEGGELRCE
ncbi:unnamed protein product [Urochloa decumbens]|uniref:Uncharacterized protein n=1 Tax=Urochloa decumbens TaxID=240449 RepID=A0ABC9DLL4_9POAL